jgi:shikimate kinase
MINPRQQWLHLMSERRSIYEKLATITVSSDNSKPSEVAKTITDKIVSKL